MTEAETRRPQAWARAINTLGHAGAETRQTPVALVLGEIGAVEGNNQPVEARGRHLFDVAGEKPAIGDHGTADAAAGDCRDKTDDFGVHQRLAALQRHISDPAAVEDRHGARERIRVNEASWADRHLVAREPAKIAGGVANVGDGKVADGRELEIECAAGAASVRGGTVRRRRPNAAVLRRQGHATTMLCRRCLLMLPARLACRQERGPLFDEASAVISQIGGRFERMASLFPLST